MSGCSSVCWCRRIPEPWICRIDNALPHEDGRGQTEAFRACGDVEVGRHEQRVEPGTGCCTDCAAVRSKTDSKRSFVLGVWLF